MYSLPLPYKKCVSMWIRSIGKLQDEPGGSLSYCIAQYQGHGRELVPVDMVSAYHPYSKHSYKQLFCAKLRICTKNRDGIISTTRLIKVVIANHRDSYSWQKRYIVNKTA